MHSSDLSCLLLRELATLRDELNAYPDERDIWARPPGVPNSAGNLALHLAGNLRWFIGAQLGATGFIRNRDAEFSTPGMPRAELLALVSAATDEVGRTLATLDDKRLDEIYPLEVGGSRMRTGLFLMHLEGHFGYHLGQIDFHRRIVTASTTSVGALPMAPLAGK